MENEQNEIESPPPGGRKFKKLIFLLLVVFILIGGAGGGFYYWHSTRTVAAAASEEKPEKPKPEAEGALKDSLPDDSEVKRVIELQPFIVNLADTDKDRYLRLSISLGVGEEEKGGEKADPVFNTRVRNAVLAVLSSKKSEDILSVEGKNKLRLELLKAAQVVSEEPHVSAIYITEFIVQL